MKSLSEMLLAYWLYLFFYIMDKVWLRILEKKELENLLQKFDTT